MVSALARKDLALGREAAAEASVAQFVPYTAHVDDFTVATKNGFLIQVVKVNGFSFETADQVDINLRKTVRATMLRGLSNSRFAVYHHIIRRAVDQYPEGFFDDRFCRDLDAAYRSRLSGRRLFINEQFITIVRRPAQGAIGMASELWRSVFTRVDKRLLEEQRAEDLKAIHDAVKKVQTNLGAYGVRRLGVVDRDGFQCSEPLSFLSYLVNLEMKDVRLPRMPLDAYLPRKRISFGKEVLELRGAAPGDVRLGALMSVRDYANVTGPGMLDTLLRLPHEFVITQSFGFVDRQVALGRMRDVERKLKSSEEGAASLEAELSDAIDNVASGKTSFGEHHLTILGIGSNGAMLDAVTSDIDAALTNYGIVAVREDINLQAGFWSQMPGNFELIARRSLISTNNFSGFASLHTFPSGKLYGNHWGEPISLLETTSGSPYWFSFHDRDVGNFTLVGPTGAGKTVLMTFLCAQAQRVNPRTVYFDKDRGAEIFIRAMGGDYTVVSNGVPSGLNPLQLPDTPENRAFLRDWLGTLATIGSQKPLSSDEEKIISDAVRANYDQPPEHRRLSILADLFGGFEVASAESLAGRFEKWHSGGDKAWLFDNADDTLELDNRTLGFDLTSILDDPTSRTPWLMYAFHRVNDLLSGERVMLMLDEGWKMLDDPSFAMRIKDWEKTIRKRNGLLGFATQSVNDIFKSEVGDSIVEQSPTNIFMPNPRADEETYCGGFGLSRHELRIVRELTPESRCFLVRHGVDSVIAKLDLSGLDEFIAVLSGRAETVALVDDLRARHGDDPSAWLPQFMERMRA
ncbi:MAG: VirB4 family type IV secretion/conjugal transfer ATPase [Pseudomonadota bacterium]